LESRSLVESIVDCDCEIAESRLADPFHLALIFPLSQDVKPAVALSNGIQDVPMAVLPDSTRLM
jgi:hypothetical protein